MTADTAGRTREKELRLALVCYGGISLAVYMHGITKEAWHLARASRAAHDHEPPLEGSAGVYAELLRLMEERGLRLRVLVDIVSGASAGALNGVFLAQAIATGQSLDPLTDLWLDSADVEALIAPDAAPASRLSKLWATPLAWAAAGRVEVPDDDPALAEVRAKLSHFIRSRWFEPPFGGDTMTGLVLDALDAMAAGTRGPRLLPDGQPLDLFVTVTDFSGYPERLTLHSPPEVVETEHRLVLSFSDGGGSNAEGEEPDGLAHPAELAFAARATSSFPGAFPPFSVGELDRVLESRGTDWTGRGHFLRRVLPRHSAAGAAEGAILIDGSVLANAPFGPAVAALRERPARREVDRRFVYVDPSPGHKFRLTRGGEGPGFFQVIMGALSELPRQQPIRDELEAIAARSERIAAAQRTLAALRPAVEAAVERLFGRTLFLNRPTPARLAAWRARAHAGARNEAGIGYAAYAHIKLEGVRRTLLDQLRRAGGDQAAGRWRRTRERLLAALDARGVGPAAVPADDDERVVAFLRAFDLAYRVRRLRLLARRIAEMEDWGKSKVMAPARDAVYASLALYLEARRAAAHPALRRAVRATRDDAEPLLDRLAGSLDLSALDGATDEKLAAGFAPLPRAERRTLLLAYLGFPYFDAATLPLLGAEVLDEFDPVKVDRISPDDAVAIRSGGAEATLKGIQFNGFGAFFSRAWRENDYLWGRLHGADRLIDVVVSALGPSDRMPPGRVARLKRNAFRAILDEEEPRLSAVPDLFRSLRAELG